MLYLNGHTGQGEIAKAWKTSIRSINKWVGLYRDQGLEGLKDKKVGPPVTVTAKVRRQIRAYRDHRLSVHEISQKLHVGLGSVCRVLYSRNRNEWLFDEDALEACLYIDGHVQCYYGKGKLGKINGQILLRHISGSPRQG